MKGPKIISLRVSSYLNQQLIFRSPKSERDKQTVRLLQPSRACALRVKTRLKFVHKIQCRYLIMPASHFDIDLEYFRLANLVHQVSCACVLATYHVLFVRMRNSNIISPYFGCGQVRIYFYTHHTQPLFEGTPPILTVAYFGICASYGAARSY